MSKPVLLYAVAGSPLLRRAHALQTLFTAQRLAERYRIHLCYPLTPGLWGKRAALTRQYAAHNIQLHLLRTTSLGRLHPRLFTGDKARFARRAAALARTLAQAQARQGRAKLAAIFTRDPVVAAELSSQTIPVIFEIHKLDSTLARGGHAAALARAEEAALRNSFAVVAITQWLARHSRRFNHRVACIPDAFEPALFKPMPQALARARLSLAPGPIALYAGLTFRDGVPLLARAARSLPAGARAVLVGGSEQDRSRLRSLAPPDKLELLPPVPVEQVPAYLAAADVLVLPYARSRFTEQFSSPLKLFEYLAMGKPIVATRVGSVTEVLTNREALLVSPTPEAIARGITTLLRNPRKARALARAAKRKSARFTYAARARAIAQLIDAARKH